MKKIDRVIEIVKTIIKIEDAEIKSCALDSLLEFLEQIKSEKEAVGKNNGRTSK